VDEWKVKDPIARFRTYLTNKGILTEEWEEETKKDLEKEVMSTFESIENKSDTEIDDIFKYHYAEMPAQLEEQLNEYKSFLEGGSK